MPIGAAIAVGSVASAGIGALAASSAASKQSSAATQAATIQSNAANRAADIQLGMFNTIRGDLTPYRNAGGAALPGYMALLGIPASAYGGGSGATTTAATPMTAAAPSFSAGSFAGQAPGQPAGQPDWDAYLSANPDVGAYFNQNAAQLQQMGFGSPQAYAQWHYQNIGQGEGRGFGAQPTAGAVPQFSNADWAAYLKANPDVATYEQQDAAKRGIAPNDPNEIASVGQWHYGTYGQTEGRGLPTFSPTGAPMPNASQSIGSFLENTPGYQFTRDQGMQSVENQLAARGLGGLSGALGKGLARFVTGLADQTYQSQIDNYRTAAGMGQSAANQTGTFGQAATSGAASSLVGGANAQAAGITGAAQAGASGVVGAANALSGGVQGAANGLLTSRVLGMYSPAAAAPAYASTPIASEPWYAEG